MATVSGNHRNHYRLEVNNHASSTEICAAVSALVYALAGAVINNDEVITHYETLEPGHAVVDYGVNAGHGTRADEDMRCVLIGLMQVQKAYPDEIVIVENIM